MSQHPEIESIVEEAIEIARKKSHEYVTTEHLLLALIRHQPFKKALDKKNSDSKSEFILLLIEKNKSTPTLEHVFMY
jgi:ATP-dependent Clp protease ATP-binding subunit ClpA